MPGIARRDRVPGQEVGNQRQQPGGRAQLRTRAVDAAFELQDFADTFAIAPQRDRVAVCIDQVGQRLQLAPLVLVVRVSKGLWIGALAGRLDLDEADQRLARRDREVGPGL